MKISSNSVALVTGGSQGIGKAVVEAFLDLGARVSFLDVKKGEGEEVQKIFLKKYGEGRSIFIPCDVCNEQEFRNAFEKTKVTFGKITIVCNNAGIRDEDNWEKVIDINLKAMMRGTYLGIEYMSTQHGNDGGVVVNVSSLTALEVYGIFPAYGASKSGILQFTRCFAKARQSDGVRVVCICPGNTNTQLIQEVLDDYPDIRERIGPFFEPGDVARDFVKLVEDDDNAGKVYECTQSCRNYVEITRVPASGQ